jgi:hypothetical protein
VFFGSWRGAGRGVGVVRVVSAAAPRPGSVGRVREGRGDGGGVGTSLTFPGRDLGRADGPAGGRGSGGRRGSVAAALRRPWPPDAGSSLGVPGDTGLVRLGPCPPGVERTRSVGLAEGGLDLRAAPTDSGARGVEEL